MAVQRLAKRRSPVLLWLHHTQVLSPVALEEEGRGARAAADWRESSQEAKATRDDTAMDRAVARVIAGAEVEAWTETVVRRAASIFVERYTTKEVELVWRVVWRVWSSRAVVAGRDVEATCHTLQNV